jgi:2-dehydropantoate 2-reductase
MRVVVVGAGAMGCLFGGLLFRSGCQVTLVDVSGTQIEAINHDGLRLELGEGSVVLPVAARYAHEVSEIPQLVVVFTKTMHTAAALEAARHLLGGDTLVLSLQNGLGNDAVIERFLPRKRIIHGVTTFPADLVSPGLVRSMGSGLTLIMSADGVVHSRLEAVRLALDEAGFNCRISGEVAAAIWEKVAFNVAMNSLTAVMRLPVGALADSPACRRLAYRMVNEVAAVANRKGIGARRDAVLATVEAALAEHREHKPSMLQDVLAGRPTEVESLNGAVVREATALGMTASVTEVLYHLVRAVEESSPWLLAQ